MCGIAGYFNTNLFQYNNINILNGMGDVIAHRGPDSAGVWLDAPAGIGFVHRRLSIVDLSEAGSQPMHSESGRFVIAFNGEIYNHLELRAWYEEEIARAPIWRGYSDTESLLACIEAFGLERTLQRSVGMFALALWDRVDGKLTLARDRVGEKPLYYGFFNGTLIFGSELQALKVHPHFSWKVSRNALSMFMQYGYVPAPHSILEGVSKLPPGSLITITRDLLPSSTQPSPIHYWSLSQVVHDGHEQPFIGDDTSAVQALESLLADAIRLQQVADVPLGAFLSGGVDSSLIVSLLQAQSSRPINTYTIGFHENKFNEAKHAAAVARHLGTQHHEFYFSGRDALKVIPKLGSIYDEPFADASQVPTRLVCEMARTSVTVALSGDAGDELFGGYNRYLFAGRLWNRMSKMPRPLRQVLARAMGRISPMRWEWLYGVTKGLLSSHWQVSQPDNKIHKLIELLAVRNEHELYNTLVSHWKLPQSIVLGGNYPPRMLGPDMTGLDFEEWMMFMDTLTYLPDDILVKVDRAAMSVGLETRVPFLDHRVVEFATRLPLDLKIRNGQGKWILRQILYKHVPPEMIERPKMGFSIPIADWLRGPLRDWAEDLLQESRLRKEGFLNPVQVRLKWIEHLSGKRNWDYQLWNVLMFQAWLIEQKTHL